MKRRLLAAADEALAATRDASAGKRGRLRLGYVGSAVYGRLPSAIRGFRRDDPVVRIDLREMTTAAQVAALRADEIDLPIVIPPLGDEGGLHTAPFDTDRLAIAPFLPSAGASRGRRDCGPSQGAVHLLPARPGPGFHDQVTRLCAAAGFTPAVTQEAHGMHAVLSLVAVEAGVAIVPASMTSIRPDEIAYRPIEGDMARFALLLCRRSGEAEPATDRLERALRR